MAFECDSKAFSLPREFLERISDQVLDNTKQLGLFDELRMKLLSRIEARKDFRQIEQDFQFETELFCRREAKLDEPRGKLRQQLEQFTGMGNHHHHHASSTMALNLSKSINYVMEKYQRELVRRYKEKSRMFLEARYVRGKASNCPSGGLIELSLPQLEPQSQQQMLVGLGLAHLERQPEEADETRPAKVEGALNLASCKSIDSGFSSSYTPSTTSPPLKSPTLASGSGAKIGSTCQSERSSRHTESQEHPDGPTTHRQQQQQQRQQQQPNQGMNKKKARKRKKKRKRRDNWGTNKDNWWEVRRLFKGRGENLNGQRRGRARNRPVGPSATPPPATSDRGGKTASQARAEIRHGNKRTTAPLLSTTPTNERPPRGGRERSRRRHNSIRRSHRRLSFRSPVSS